MFAIQFLHYFLLCMYFIKGLSLHLPNQLFNSNNKNKSTNFNESIWLSIIFLKTLKRIEGTLNIEAGLMAGMEKNPRQAIIAPMVSKEIGAETKSIL